MKPNLSKSQYIKGLQCEKALWFSRNRRDIKPEIDEMTKKLFNIGHKVGELAQTYFEDGIEVKEQYWATEKAVQTTSYYIEDGYQDIYEATAIHPIDGSHARIDILHREDDAWELIEVKSSTRLQDYHINDMALQYHVFRGAGHDIQSCKMMLLNKQYEQEKNIAPADLFKFEDITEAVKAKQKEINDNLASLNKMIVNPDEPKIEIGNHCTKPFKCGYKYHCWGN